MLADWAVAFGMQAAILIYLPHSKTFFICLFKILATGTGYFPAAHQWFEECFKNFQSLTVFCQITNYSFGVHEDNLLRSANFSFSHNGKLSIIT